MAKEEYCYSFTLLFPLQNTVQCGPLSNLNFNSISFDQKFESGQKLFLFHVLTKCVSLELELDQVKEAEPHMYKGQSAPDIQQSKESKQGQLASTVARGCTVAAVGLPWCRRITANRKSAFSKTRGWGVVAYVELSRVCGRAAPPPPANAAAGLANDSIWAAPRDARQRVWGSTGFATRWDTGREVRAVWWAEKARVGARGRWRSCVSACDHAVAGQVQGSTLSRGRNTGGGRFPKKNVCVHCNGCIQKWFIYALYYAVILFEAE